MSEFMHIYVHQFKTKATELAKDKNQYKKR